MPLDTPSAGSRDAVVDTATHSLRFERTVAASPAEVFEAWTEADQIGAWWDPNGRPLARCDIDLRVGGGFVFVNQGHEDRPFAGTYTEIAPPTRLAFEAMGSIGTVDLASVDDGTRMVVIIACASEQQLQMFVQMGVASGTAQTLDNLVARFAA